MKFNKTLLTTAILASSLVLTACNEKKAETKAPEKAKTEQVAKQAPAKAEQTKNKAETITKITPTPIALYNASLQVKPVSIDLGKDKNNVAMIQYKYKVTNVGLIPILAAQWANQMVYKNKLIDIQLIDLPFKNGLAPKASIDLTFTKALSDYPENIRAEITKDGKISLPPLPGTIIYGDRSTLSVIPPELLTNYVAQQQNKLKPKAEKAVEKAVAKPAAKTEEVKTKK